MNFPLVSVVIAVKNGERFLSEALASVQSQTYANYEIIVMDDNSTDGTERIAKSYPGVRYLRSAGNGIAAANNQGIEAARGVLIAFFSYDDLWAPNKLSRQVDNLLSFPQVQYTITRFRYFLEPGCALPPGFNSQLLGKDLMGRILETLVVWKSLFDTVGKFDTSYSVAQDVDWYARAKDQGVPMAILPEVLLFKRIHRGNNTNLNIRANNQQLIQIMRESIHRQRGRKIDRPEK